jgi:hypothetical protein
MYRLRWTVLLLALGCDDGSQSGVDLGTLDGSVDATLLDAAVTGGMDGGMDAGGDGRIVPSPRDMGPDRTRAGLTVYLDGEPAGGVLVMQGGTNTTFRTDANGFVEVPIDFTLSEYPVILASHPQARIRGVEIWPEDPPPERLDLTRYGPDNPAYTFLDPGEPRRRDSTGQCGHCHLSMNDDWFTSPHRTSASNPVVRSVFRGVGAAGRVAPSVTEVLDGFGECADCHAPGMDGRLGGRNLLEAEGFAEQYGVHCDVCHRVESVDLQNDAPGVGGRLIMHRPSDPGPVTLGANGVLPLTFGPSHDSPNPRMGSVQRDHFRDGRICNGCHEYAAQQGDPARWPDGRLPIHTTYSEWKTGALGEAAQCPDCHMPPRADNANGSDLQAFPLASIGITGGFIRPAGAARSHSWVGPRTPESGMLELAAALFVRHRVEAGELVAEVTLRNQGAGHALPTGEPLRGVYVHVEAFCDDVPLAAVGGDALPLWTGALESRAADADWTRWPGAVPGEWLRVVRRPGTWHDYDGVAPFTADRPAAEKGLPVETVVGAARIVAVDANGTVELDGRLPPGDRVYRVRPGLAAGAPGFAYARVLVDADGRTMVPHYLATDVQSDNRLMPMQAWTSTHRFEAACATPRVVARAVYRRYPAQMAAERGWPETDAIMTEVFR